MSKKSVLKSAVIVSGACLALSIAFAGAAWAGAGPAGHGHGKDKGAMGKMMKGHAHPDETAYGKPGDPKMQSRVVEIMMKEGDGNMSFVPALVTVKKGEQIRFKLKNIGELDHEIVIATLEENLKHAKVMARFPNMEHADPNAKRLKPKTSGEILWHFTKVGEFDMSCLIPGHREAGMTGKVVVK